jgi:N-carbamoylputrescine amidase
MMGIPRRTPDVTFPATSIEKMPMSRIVRAGLIQATLCEPSTSPVAKIRRAMVDKHVTLIAQAAEQGAQVVCLQELFYGPYFCAEQQTRWYELTERVPGGRDRRRRALPR